MHLINLYLQLIRRLSKFGISLSPTRKLDLLDACGDVSRSTIVKVLKKQPMVKVTGDNLDIMIRTQHQSTDHTHQDLHLFTSNIIFHRIPLNNVSDVSPVVNLEEILPQQFMLTPVEKNHLLQSNSVLAGRIMCNHFPKFKWMASVLPDHIPQTYGDYVSQKSKVYPLPIVMKNEAKYEECVDILDHYEDELIALYTAAHGNHPNDIDCIQMQIQGRALNLLHVLASCS